MTSENVAAQLYYNAIYTDSTGKTDHNALISDKEIAVSDGWQTYTFEFTVPADALLTGEQQFAFYANPIGEESVGYRIDNLVIEQLD